MSSPFAEHVLPNGLRLVFESIPRIHSTAIGFLCRTGSRDELGSQAGISHFLEHMCFKGTTRRDWRQISLDVDDLGALWNAYTWWEGTAYFHWVQSERTSDSIEILSDMMRSTLPAEEFEMEKKVILEEIAMYRDRPDSLIIDEVIQGAFSGHPLGQSVLGTEESVGGIQRDQMADYLRTRYAPNNLTFVITGSFDQDEVIAALEEQCGDWVASDVDRDQRPPEFHPGRKVERREGVQREHIALAVPAPPASNDWGPVADLTAYYLGAPSNSRLFWSVVQQGLADEASSDYYGFSDAGLFYIYLSVDPENAAPVLDIVNRELSDLKKGLDPEALDRARTKIATSLVCNGENGLNRFSHLTYDLSTGTPLKTIDEVIAELEAVTPARIAEYLEAYPVDVEPNLVALGPLESL